MNVIKKMDDIGRIVIPRDIRNSFRWMGGDEIEIIPNDDGTILLRKHEERNIVQELKELNAEWVNDPEINQRFLDLIHTLESKN